MNHDPTFWGKFDPDKYAKLTRAKMQRRLVNFAIVYLSATTATLLALIGANAWGFAHLSEHLMDKLVTLTMGQFGAAIVMLYRAIFRPDSRNNKGGPKP